MPAAGCRSISSLLKERLLTSRVPRMWFWKRPEQHKSTSPSMHHRSTYISPLSIFAIPKNIEFCYEWVTSHVRNKKACWENLIHLSILRTALCYVQFEQKREREREGKEEEISSFIYDSSWEPWACKLCWRDFYSSFTPKRYVLSAHTHTLAHFILHSARLWTGNKVFIRWTMKANEKMFWLSIFSLSLLKFIRTCLFDLRAK
jgi:hypothetical protein